MVEEDPAARGLGLVWASLSWAGWGWAGWEGRAQTAASAWRARQFGASAPPAPGRLSAG